MHYRRSDTHNTVDARKNPQQHISGIHPRASVLHGVAYYSKIDR